MTIESTFDTPVKSHKKDTSDMNRVRDTGPQKKLETNRSLSARELLQRAGTVQDNAATPYTSGANMVSAVPKVARRMDSTRVSIRALPPFSFPPVLIPCKAPRPRGQLHCNSSTSHTQTMK